MKLLQSKAELINLTNPGAHNEAMMELGARQYVKKQKPLLADVPRKSFL